MKKSLPKNLALVLFVCLTVLLARDIFDGQLAFGLFAAGAFCGAPLLSAIAYTLSGLFFGSSAVLVRAVQAVVLLLAFFVHKKTRKSMTKWLFAFYLILSNVFFCVYNFVDFSWLFDKMFFALSGIAVAFLGVYAFTALFSRGILHRPTFDELVCIALLAIAVGFCLASFNFFEYNLLMFVAPFSILLMLSVCSNQAGLISATLFSLAGLFASNNFALFSVYILMSLSALVFNKVNRFASGISLVIADVLMAYFFDVYGSFDMLTLLPTVVSVVAFFCIPGKTLQRLSDLLSSNNNHASKGIINKLRQSLAQKLYRLSDVFFSMKSAFVAMTGKGLSSENAKKAIVREVCESVCFDCKMKNNCWRNNLATIEQSFLQLAECAVENGKTTILDVNSCLSVNCDRIGLLLSSINSQAQSYSAYISRTNENDSNRLLISQQLGGVSRIMQQLASECKGRLTFNSEKESEIVEKLIFHNVFCNEAVFIEQSNGISVILTVHKKDLDSQVICSVVESVLKVKTKIDRVEPCEGENWMTVYLCEEPRFCLTYGIRSHAKKGGNVSGDTHSFVKIDNNRFLLAICDGMGSGQSAESVSSTAISLVENFYRAGFPSDVILSCANKLLAGFNTETFTAVDICVVDLSSGLVDFIKLGASDGLLKTSSEVKFVSGSSLPLGILDETHPSVTKAVLRSGDYVLIASDGFWDCFKSADTVADMLSQVVLTNPQLVADDFIERALSSCKNSPKDDVTLIVARIA